MTCLFFLFEQSFIKISIPINLFVIKLPHFYFFAGAKTPTSFPEPDLPELAFVGTTSLFHLVIAASCFTFLILTNISSRLQRSIERRKIFLD